MSKETGSFENRIKKAYEKFYESVTVGKEHDVRARFIRHFIMDGLGYPEDCYSARARSGEVQRMYDSEENSSPNI